MKTYQNRNEVTDNHTWLVDGNDLIEVLGSTGTALGLHQLSEELKNAKTEHDAANALINCSAARAVEEEARDRIVNAPVSYGSNYEGTEDEGAYHEGD